MEKLRINCCRFRTSISFPGSKNPLEPCSKQTGLSTRPSPPFGYGIWNRGPKPNRAGPEASRPRSPGPAEPPSPGGAVIPAVSTPPTSAPSVPFSRSGFPRKAPPRRSGPSIEEPFPSGLSSFPLTGGFPPAAPHAARRQRSAAGDRNLPYLFSGGASPFAPRWDPAVLYHTGSSGVGTYKYYSCFKPPAHGQNRRRKKRINLVYRIRRSPSIRMGTGRRRALRPNFLTFRFDVGFSSREGCRTKSARFRGSPPEKGIP